MKKTFPIFIIALGIGLLTVLGIGRFSTAYALQQDKELPEAVLDGVDAVQAMAVANKWKYSHKEINSTVTTREVIFKFPSKKKLFNFNKGKEKKIPLPDDKMVVAVAPYVYQTHE